MNAKIKVLGIVIDEMEKVLLIKEKVKRRDGYLWNAIRGTYDNAMETVEEALIRECVEEANATVEIIETLPYYVANYNERKIRVYLPFVCKLMNEDIKVGTKEKQDALEEEIVEVKLFSKEEFRTLSESDFVEEAVYNILNQYFK